jgi:hemoglobin
MQSGGASCPPKLEGDAGMEDSIYKKYGGFSKVSRVVLAFYDRILDDDLIGPYFDDIDMNRIVDHQTKFISSLLGGPASYTDDQIRKMHSHLKIGPEEFEALVVILREVLAEHGFEDEDIETIVLAFGGRRNLVVK